MSYYSEEQLRSLGFKFLGHNVKVSDKASIYDAAKITIGDNSRVDDFCILSGSISIGSYCHITPMCLIAGGEPGVFISDFSTLAYGVKVFAQSDDYSGQSLVNSMIAKKFKKEKKEAVYLQRQTIVGAGSIVLPGVEISEGCAVGAMSLVLKSTQPWGIYAGVPARRIKERERNILELEKEFLREKPHDSIQ